MANQQSYQSPQEQPFLDRHRNLISDICMLMPALTVMVLIRRGVGYRLMPRGYLFGPAIALYFLGVGTREQNVQYPQALEYFAGVFLIAGLAQKFLRWREIRSGMETFSYSTGVSIFQTKRSPAFLRRRGRTNRFGDPFIVMFMGFILAQAGVVSLGLYLMFAGLMLGAFEFFVRGHVDTRLLDVSDNLVAADAQSNDVKFVKGSGRRVNTSTENAIPTGLAADIKRRRR